MELRSNLSKAQLWGSYIFQGVLAAMFLAAAFGNLVGAEFAVQGAIDMGYPASSVLYLGLILLVSTVLFIIPKTTMIGAILLSAWLGGAVATHMIHGDGLGMTIMPVVIGILVWISILIRYKKFGI